MFKKVDSAKNDLVLAEFNEEANVEYEGLVDVMKFKLGVIRRELAADCVMLNALILDGIFEDKFVVFKELLGDKLLIVGPKLSA